MAERRNDAYNNLKIEIAMWLKDEYIDRLVKNQDTTVTVDFNCETVMKGVTIDFATQT